MGLSEKRGRKEKIQEDPRNLRWANDVEGLGYKLLQGMGWEAGKGLGLNEDGAKDYVKVKKRDDNSGLGSSKGITENSSNLLELDQVFKSISEHSIDNSEQSIKKEKKKKSSKETTTIVNHRALHRKRYRDAKQKALTNPKHLSEILGVKLSE